MTMRFSSDWLDMLRDRVTLSSLIGRTLPLKKSGHEHKACCPFHAEQTASFTVSDAKGFYHCFSCGAHGDAIRWLTDKGGLSFIDAVKQLADFAGVALPASDPAAAAREARRALLFEIMEAAAAWFVAQLASDAGDAARAYTVQRGLSAETLRDFGIGFAPASRSALLIALTRFGTPALIEAGLVIAVEGKPAYDRFRGRLMIPIRDGRGRVIAFGGRILGEGEPKYLNSPETPLFDKGRTLFNLDRARIASRSAKRVLLVEGYLDVIALAQGRIGEAVAPLGTALSEHQLETLWSMTNIPTVCFDGDSAGQAASLRAAVRALPVMRGSQSLSFVTLPAGQDPDDLIREGGQAALEALLLTASQPLVDRLWTSELAAHALDTPEARAGLRQRLTDHVRTIGDPDVRMQYAAEFRRRFDALFNVSCASYQLAISKPAVSEAQRAIGENGVDAVFVRAVLVGLLRHPLVLQTSHAQLARIAIADADCAALRDALIAERDVAVDPGELHRLALSDALGKALMQRGGLAFSFTRASDNPAIARSDLGLAISALVDRASLDVELAAATAVLAEAFDDASYLAQQQLIAKRAQTNADLALLLHPDD